MWFGLAGWRGCTGASSLARSVREACRIDRGTDRGGRRRNMICLEPSGVSREAHLPTQQSSSSPQARFPCAHEHPCGSRGVEVPPGQGPGPTLGLIDRVRERDAFVRLRRDGVRVRTDPLWCSFVLDPDLVPPQVAFAIGRAVGPAVSRNRLRRRLRAVLANSDVPPGAVPDRRVESRPANLRSPRSSGRWDRCSTRCADTSTATTIDLDPAPCAVVDRGVSAGLRRPTFTLPLLPELFELCP